MIDDVHEPEGDDPEGKKSGKLFKSGLVPRSVERNGGNRNVGSNTRLSLA